MILFLTHDLMIFSTADTDARRLGVPLQRMVDLESVVSAVQQGDVKKLFVDLTTPGISPDQIAAALKDRTPLPETIAFAPHVKETLLAESRPMFDRVMTRGQFHRKLGELLV